MATFSHHLHLKMHPDDRLAAAAGGAARCMGDSAGLTTDAILELQAAVLGACKKCFEGQAAGKSCEIHLQRTEDRIQVEVMVPECAAPNEKEKIEWPGIDEVRCEARDDGGILRLTKYVVTAPEVD